MPAFLKIENIGVCPPEGFTVLGVSLADKSSHRGVIGQFGSGNKHGVAVLLRESGLVSVRADGQRRLYRLQSAKLAEVDAWLAPYRRAWAGRLDALERHLEDEQ